MIPFEEIDNRLADISKDRAWLAAVSGRKLRSIGDALAPSSADTSKRSPLLQKALTDAIEGEERRQREVVISPVRLPERVTLEPSKSEFQAWCYAYKHSMFDTLEDWVIYATNQAAEREANNQQEKRDAGQSS